MRNVDVVVFVNDGNVSRLFQVIKSRRYEVRYPLPHEHELGKPEDLLSWHLMMLKDSRHDALLNVHLKPERLGLDDSSLVRLRTVTVDGEKIVVPSPEDYLVTKLIFRKSSSHDFEDIMSTLINQYGKIDWKYLENKAKNIAFYFC